MNRGYVFSLLVALMLGFFMLISYYYLVERPQPETHTGFISSRGMVAYSLAGDLADEIPVSVVRGARLSVTETVPHSGTYQALEEWSSLLAKYQDSARHNASIDLTNASGIDSELWLAGDGVEYLTNGSSFTLSHSSSYLLVNDSVAHVSNGNCDFDGSGDVETRVIVDNFDSGVGYTSPGSAYSCFINFTGTENMTITVGNDSKLALDYKNAPANYTQRVSFDGPDKLYVAFDKYNGTTGTSSPWTESFNGTKRYATVAGMNFVLADTDSDGTYDYVFADADGDGVFNGVNDRWYLREGAVALSGKVFYMRFDLAGNWIALYNVLGTSSLGSWRAVVV